VVIPSGARFPVKITANLELFLSLFITFRTGDASMILVTGASGKTGQTIVRALARSGTEPVRAMVRRAEQIEALTAEGAQQVICGDMRDARQMCAAFAGVRAVYHICPNMSPDELMMAENAILAARECGEVEHFVYHSVLHPQVEAMSHHWLKLRVEERLFTAGIAFTIVQPGPYMQNVLWYWNSITQQGIYPVPYALEARLSMVDLEDVAEAAARIFQQAGHTGAIYELGGPEALSQHEVAEILGQALGRKVEAQVQDRREWEQRARAGQMNAYAVETLLKMFEYYEQFGLVGSSRVLEWLLGRPACRFADYLARVTRAAKGD
jgi:NAD(P)H dehydrogenase (quinone)